MKNILVCVLITAALIAVLAGTATAKMESGNYCMPESVFSAGGEPVASENYGINSTLGQPSPLMQDYDNVPSSQGYFHAPGFWFATMDYDRPRVVSTNPAHGAEGIPRNLQWIEVTFDREMMYRWSISCYSPEWMLSSATQVVWSVDMKTVRFSRDNTELLSSYNTIEIILNPPNFDPEFCDTEGYCLNPFTFSFTTGEETLIGLSSLSAQFILGKIVVSWSTDTEINNAGFNIYRAESGNGEYQKINDALIPAQGSVTQGASYEFIDKDVKLWQTYYYKLEDIDLNGVTTKHGPVSATPRLINMFR